MRIAILTALLALPLSAQAQPQPAANPNIAATVNGQPITIAELDAALNIHLFSSPITIEQRRRLRAVLINDLIDDTLLKQFLARNGPKVDPAEIEAQMKALTAQLAKENRSFAAYLRATGQTEAQLRADWALQIQLAGYVRQQITQEQLRAYHAANRDYFDRVEVRASHILAQVARNAVPADRTAAREKLVAIRADLLAGKIDFAAAALKFSDCPSSKKGGDLGFVFRRGLPEDEPLARVAFAMKVGEVSDVIESEYGFHILTVTDRKPGVRSIFEKCAQEVLEAYTDDFRADLARKLRKDGQVTITLP